MIRHVFKLVWNRKRSTGLILTEITICFLVLCGVLASALYVGVQWTKPLGFDYANVWSVEVSGIGVGASEEQQKADSRALADLLRTARALPVVESAALSTNTPYSGSSWNDSTRLPSGESVLFGWTISTPALPEVMHLQLREGRWLEEADDALGYTPVVISHQLAQGLFGSESAIGKDVPEDVREGGEPDSEDEEEIQRVVGVMQDYRRHGEIQDEAYMMLLPVDWTSANTIPRELVLRVRQGTTMDFEETLVKAMQQVAPQWTYDTVLLESRRTQMLLAYIGPMLLAGVVALFLVLMVGLGLVGVLWLSVSRRTSELGLRRALGATGRSVRYQIVGELWALTAIAVGLGTLIFLQFPLFGVNFGVDTVIFVGGVVLATLVIYAFVTFCGLYPAWLATRIQPANALQYE
jgi:putative ABC transport system permease protein